MNAGVRVWDPLVRVLHWTLVASILAAWITGEIEKEAAQRFHEWAGYAALAIVALRLPWGLFGTRYARFPQFLRGPRATLAYAGQVAAGREPRHLGHNPLGGWMVVTLLAAVAAAGLSGWLMTTDRFWGVEWVEEVHEALANTLFALAGLHVAGVVFTSLRHRENLVRAMLTGRKRPPQPGDVA
jgi:cytochrome b